MSGRLQITFGPDMPPATVEIVSPDLETVGRVWLSGGRSAEVDVPSEESFLRVHLSSGQTVTLLDPGNLDRHVDLAALMERTGAAISDIPLRPGKRISARKSRGRSAEELGDSTLGVAPEQLHPVLTGGMEVRLKRPDGEPVPGVKAAGGESVIFRGGGRWMEPCDLTVTIPDGELGVRLPGLLSDVRVSVFELEGNLRLISVLVRTENPAADTLGGYIARGDLHSAAAMASWAVRAEEMLFDKMVDPFAAALGAYLLLRLRRFDLMHSWARNLADRFPDFADGSVIWAWQQIHERGEEKTIRDYLFRAAAIGVPVFTEGLKLLVTGLRRLGPNGLEIQRRLSAETGMVLWDAPFTSSLRAARPTDGLVRFEVGYGSAEGLFKAADRPYRPSKPQEGSRVVTLVAAKHDLFFGESLVGEGNELAHIDLIIGSKLGHAGKALTLAFAGNSDGVITLLATVAPNLPAKPDTLLLNKVTIRSATQAVLMFGVAQAVARAVVDSVSSGVIPRDKVDDYCIVVSVFIHWEAKNEKKLYDFNYRATKEAIERALKGQPNVDETIRGAKTATHPFAGGTDNQ